MRDRMNIKKIVELGERCIWVRWWWRDIKMPWWKYDLRIHVGELQKIVMWENHKK